MMNILFRFLIFALFSQSVLSNTGLNDALTAFEARDYGQAVKLLEEMVDSETARDPTFHLARVQYRVGKYNDARKTLKRLLNNHPEDADGFYLSGLVNLSLVGEVSIFKKISTAKRALSDWQQAVDINPDHLNAQYAIFAYYANAPGIAGGDLDQAVQIQQALSKQDTAFGTMATALLLAKEKSTHPQAEAAYQTTIKLMDRAGPHFALAQFYLSAEQHDKAIDQARLFLEKEKRWWDPDITMAHLIIGSAQAELGQHVPARKTLELAVSLKPNPQIMELLEEKLDDLDNL
jgi:tetratricopeptide (TPR) repeat protein